MPKFVPQSGVRIAVTDTEARSQGGNVDPETLEELQAILANAASSVSVISYFTILIFS